MLLLAFTALKDGIRRQEFVFRVALHKGEHALLIAIGFDWADFLFFLWGIGLAFCASAGVSCQQSDWKC